MSQELKVISDVYDFMLWLLQHIEKFPRQHRYGLGRDLEARLQTILTLLLRAKYSRDKRRHLHETNIELEVLRLQLRLAKDLQLLPIKSHHHAAGQTLIIGRQIGGWINRQSR